MQFDNNVFYPTIEIAIKLINDQFPEYAHLQIKEVDAQGHDNRTYRLGENLLIRMPTAEKYALKVPKEQELLPKLRQQLSIPIPTPIKMGQPSTNYPYQFSIYKWLSGVNLNLLNLNAIEKEQLAMDLANFLNELRCIKNISGPTPGQHNFWRGANVQVYDQQAREQIKMLSNTVNTKNALKLWTQACATQWSNAPVWIHGDLATGNILIQNNKLCAVIDFGGTAIGDPACDLVIAWTYFEKKSRKIFIKNIGLDDNSWLRARAWVLWKATFELCRPENKNNPNALQQKKIIEDVLRF